MGSQRSRAVAAGASADLGLDRMFSESGGGASMAEGVPVVDTGPIRHDESVQQEFIDAVVRKMDRDSARYLTDKAIINAAFTGAICYVAGITERGRDIGKISDDFYREVFTFRRSNTASHRPH